jgi:hypothetical protein
MATNKPAHYSINKVTSGYNGDERWIVVKNPGRHRVSVQAHRSRRSAEFTAEALNIQELVKSPEEDPRSYQVRRAEAEALYRGWTFNSFGEVVEVGDTRSIIAWGFGVPNFCVGTAARVLARTKTGKRWTIEFCGHDAADRRTASVPPDVLGHKVSS